MKHYLALVVLTLGVLLGGCDRPSTEQVGKVQSATAVSGDLTSTSLTVSGCVNNESTCAYGTLVTLQACVGDITRSGVEAPILIPGMVTFTIDGTTTLSGTLSYPSNCTSVTINSLVPALQPPHSVAASYQGGIDSGITFNPSFSSTANIYVVQAETETTMTLPEEALVYGEGATIGLNVQRFPATPAPSGVSANPNPTTGIAPQGTVSITLRETPCLSGLAVQDIGDGTNSSVNVQIADGMLGSCFIDEGAEQGISAMFTASTNFAGSSDFGSIDVEQASATASFNSSTTTSAEVGQAITLSATVTPNAPSTVTPAGTAQFSIFPGGTTETPIDTAFVVLGSDGVGTLSIQSPSFTIGTYDVYLLYAADESGNWASTKTAEKTSFTVRSPTYTVALTMNATPPTKTTTDYTSTFGLPVTLTATITSDATQAPTGTVDFYEDSDATAFASVAFTGTSSVSTSAFRLEGGSHTITAKYSGDTNHVNSPPGGQDAEVLTIAAHDTSTTMGNTPSPSKYGELVTFTSHTGFTASSESDIPPSAPSGTISFKLGETTICSRTISTTNDATLGNASCSTRLLPVGASTAVTATFVSAATNDFNGSSGTSTQTVQKASTAVALTSSVPITTFGGPVTLTALVSSPGADNRGGNYDLVNEIVKKNPALLSGTVTFSDGTTVLGTSTVGTAAGNAEQYSFTTSAPLAVGTHGLTAVYSGNGTFAASPTSNQVIVLINQDGASAALTSSANPATFGQAITFTTTLTSTTSTGATGSLTVLDGATVLGTSTLAASGDNQSTGTFTSSTLAVGSHTINVTYSGDATHVGGPVATLVETVNPALTTTTLATSGATVFSQPLTLTATVASTVAGDLTGTVTFSDGSTVLGTALASAGGVATLTPTTSFTIGSHFLKATYGGSTNYGSSFGVASATVTKASTTTTLSSASNPSLLGTSVNLVATVSAVAPATASPTGTVSFTIDNGSVRTAAIDGNGNATLAATGLDEGAHTVVATYAADTHFTGSAAGSLSQSVVTSAATIVVTSAPAAATFGTTVTFTATLQGTPASGTPTGSVDFSNGAVFIGSQPLTNGVATISTPLLPVGSNIISARYSGDSTYAVVTGTLPVTVGKAATTTTIASSLNPATVGQPVTITATVTSAATGATGQVEFFSGTTSLGKVALSGTTASFTATSLGATGTVALSAVYQGDDRFATSTSATLTETVNAAPESGSDGGGAGETNPTTGTSNPGVSSDGGNVNFNVGSTGNSDNSCTVTVPGSTTSGFGSILGIGIAALFITRRRRR